MSDWDNYSENLAFDPANSMPRCDIEELKEKVKKLEDKLKIAKEALEFYAVKKHLEEAFIINSFGGGCDEVDGDVENGYKARQALAKIRGE